MDLKSLEGIVHGLAPKDWRGKHDGFPVESVSVVDCGLNLANQKFWLKVRFTDLAATHTLMGKMAVAEAGQQGGKDEITLDDKPVDGDDCKFGLQFELFPPKAKVVIVYSYYNDKREANRYEFTAPIPIHLFGM